MNETAEKRANRIVAICGIKNSGKTTLISRLTEELSGRGYKVAVIKHDGHDFECDVPGTDSWRYVQSGAYGAACFSKNRMFIHKAVQNVAVEQLIGLFPEADIIMVEGMKDSSMDKIEIVRSGISAEPVSNPDGRFLVVTDILELKCGCDTAGFDDIEVIVEKMMGRLPV